MKRTRIARTTIEELRKRIQTAEKRKKEYIKYLQNLKDKYSQGEISYAFYIETIYKKTDGRNISEWIEYFEHYIKNCEKIIKKQKRTIVKNQLPVLFLSLFFIFIVISSGFYPLKFTGFAVKEQKQEFTQTLNLEFAESTTYEWRPENLGVLNSVKLSGEIEGDGIIKVYLEDNLILDSEELKLEIPLEIGYILIILLILIYIILKKYKLKIFKSIKHLKKKKLLLLLAGFFIAGFFIFLIFSGGYANNSFTFTGKASHEVDLNISIIEKSKFSSDSQTSQTPEEETSQKTVKSSTEKIKPWSVLESGEKTIKIPLAAGYFLLITFLLIILYIFLRKFKNKKKKFFVVIFIFLTVSFIFIFSIYPLKNTSVILGSVVESSMDSPAIETEDIPQETPAEEVPETSVEQIEENITLEEAEENIAEEIPENVTEVEEPIETQEEAPEEIKIPTKKFKNICEETCDLKELNLNKTSYILRIEIVGDLKLKLDEIKYDLITFKEISEPEENVTEIPVEIPEKPEEKEISVTTKQYKAIINRPVKWVKKVNVVNLKEETGESTIEIPKQAINITVKTGEEIPEALKEIEEYEEVIEKADRTEIAKGTITGASILEIKSEKSIFIKIKNLINKFTITGKVIQEKELQEEITETAESKIIDVWDIAVQTQEIEIAIEYYTEGPTAVEEETDRGKKVIVSGSEELNYTDILAFAEIPEKFSIEEENRIKIFWKEENKYVFFDAYDLDSNGKLDYVEWIVPHLSNQTFEIILITKAEHLNSNRQFISDIYDETKELDDIWSETIPNRHYIRVTFEQNLTNENDITIYPRIVTGNPRVEVYEVDGTELIAEFTSITSNQYNIVSLASLTGSQDVFDLKVLGGSVEIEHIIDPPGKIDDGGTFSISDTSVAIGGQTSMATTITHNNKDNEQYDIFMEDTGNKRITDVCGDNQIIIVSVKEDHPDCSVASSNAVYNDYITCTSNFPSGGGLTVNVNYTIQGCSAGGPTTYRLDQISSTGGQDAFTGTDTLTVSAEADNEFPIFSNYQNDTPENTEYSPNYDWGFNVTITSTNGTVWIRFDNTNYSASNISASIFNVTLSDSSAGTHYYNWSSYGNGTSHNFNMSNTQSYVIAQNSSLVLGLTANTPIDYGTTTDFTGSGCPTQLSCSLNISNAVYGAGTISANYSTSGNSNYSVTSTEFTVTINQAIPEAVLTNTTALTVTYGTAINVSFEETNSGDSDVTYKICRDNVDATSENGLNVTLGVGAYDYILNTTGGTNWTANASMDSYTITIEIATGEINGTINGTQGNFTAVNGTATQNIYINATNKTGYGAGKIYVNGTLYNSGTMPLFNVTNLPVGFYNITFEYDGNTNYSSDSEVWWVNITLVLNQAPTNPSPEINSTDGTNRSNQNLNCYDTISDPDATDLLNVTVRWYNSSVLALTVDYNNSYAVDSFFNATLNFANTSKGENWSCSLRLYDGTVYSDWVNSTHIVNVTNTAPKITAVYNNTINVSSGPTENTITDIIINFTVYDTDGASDLNDATAMANITYDITRQNLSCYKYQSAGDYANYTCNITMWWWDGSGTWNITTYIEDDDAGSNMNSSADFYVGLRTAFVIAPGILKWPGISPGGTNQTSNNDPLVLNNTGNDVIGIGGIEINATNLLGEEDPSYGLWAGNFSVDWQTGGSSCAGAACLECEGSVMNRSICQSIGTANLTKGNHTINNGDTGQEELYFCLRLSGAELSTQAYSTANETEWAWIVQIL